VAEFSRKDARANRPVPANIHATQENNESHTGIIETPFAFTRGVAVPLAGRAAVRR
jgi:hypothetical protein